MAKKKDTLKDLNAFIKSQGNKDKEADKDFLQQKPTSLADVDALKENIKQLDNIEDGDLLENELTVFISKIATEHQINERQVLYRLCEKVLENQSEVEPNDIMLHNMVLYLKHQDLVVNKLN